MRFSKKELCNFGNLEKFIDLLSKIEPEVTSQGGNQGNKHSSPSLLSSVLTWPKSKWIQRHGRPADKATQVSFMGQRAPRKRKISIFGGAHKFLHNDFYLILIGCLFLVDLQDINFLSSPSLWLTLLFFLVSFDPWKD